MTDTSTPDRMETDVLIVGGGFAGLACAICWPKTCDRHFTILAASLEKSQTARS